MLATAGTVRSAMRVKSGSVAPAAAGPGVVTGRAAPVVCGARRRVGEPGDDPSGHEADAGEQQGNEGETPHDGLRG